MNYDCWCYNVNIQVKLLNNDQFPNCTVKAKNVRLAAQKIAA